MNFHALAAVGGCKEMAIRISQTRHQVFPKILNAFVKEAIFYFIDEEDFGFLFASIRA